jgi:two-component system, NarL family, sensor kinase
MDDNNEYKLEADRNLPPALLQNDKSLARCGSCWCVDKYFENRLTDAVNIMSCRRLSTAKEGGYGDTCGFTHHATVPLRIGDRKFGLLNVGSAGKNHFEDEELALLQSVAFQIGVAVERMRLHQAEQRRAEQFARLGEFSRELHQSVSAGIAQVQLAEITVELLAKHFDWPAAAILERTSGRYHVQAMHAGHTLIHDYIRLPKSAECSLDRMRKISRSFEISAQDIANLTEQWPSPSGAALAAPILAISGSADRILLVEGSQPSFLTRIESEVLEAVTDHIASAMEHARLEENRRELVRVEERNRLARDLHDSVSQMLFSLTMTAKGAEAFLCEQDFEAAREAMQDITGLSKDALKEMRSLIMQLRPANLDGGIAAALQDYGKRLGINVVLKVNGCIRQLPPHIEETLWRIGQETINNVAKHASAEQVEIALYMQENELIYVAKDHGSGVNLDALTAAGRSLGLSIMRERVETAGGRLKLTSAPDEGMLIEAALPLALRKEEEA